MSRAPEVLILTRLKDARAHLEGYIASLASLTWPIERRRLGFLESDSRDDTHGELERRRPELESLFASVGLWKKNFGYRLSPDLPRWSPRLQIVRRTILARSRNHLLFRATPIGSFGSTSTWSNIRRTSSSACSPPGRASCTRTACSTRAARASITMPGLARATP